MAEFGWISGREKVVVGGGGGAYMELEVSTKHLERSFKRTDGSITLQLFAYWLTDFRLVELRETELRKYMLYFQFCL